MDKNVDHKNATYTIYVAFFWHTLLSRKRSQNEDHVEVETTTFIQLLLTEVMDGKGSVSYTHLTLPTRLLV